MTLTDSIGKIITEIKYCYNPENEYGLQEFESFIKIDNDKVIQIPYFPAEEWNESETLKKFELARKVESKPIELISTKSSKVIFLIIILSLITFIYYHPLIFCSA